MYLVVACIVGNPTRNGEIIVLFSADRLVASAGAMDHSRSQEWEKLRATIAQWNDNRLDLFELSEPDQSLNFHGVMR